eukprot:7389090-Prymnesium_polylepis.1
MPRRERALAQHVDVAVGDEHRDDARAVDAAVAGRRPMERVRHHVRTVERPPVLLGTAVVAYEDARGGDVASAHGRLERRRAVQGDALLERLSDRGRVALSRGAKQADAYVILPGYEKLLCGRLAGVERAAVALHVPL